MNTSSSQPASETKLTVGRFDWMTLSSTPVIGRPGGEQIVRTPKAGDAIGSALRHVYGETALPSDILTLLRALDNAPLRNC